VAAMKDPRAPRSKPSAGTRRKLVEIDDETWHALTMLARDQASSFQELADEAFRDVLAKHGRPTDLKAALKRSAKLSDSPKRSR
jgi:hypothetical protein